MMSLQGPANFYKAESSGTSNDFMFAVRPKSERGLWIAIRLVMAPLSLWSSYVLISPVAASSEEWTRAVDQI